MLSPLSLMNMEMQLYGGMGMNSTAPSCMNNYMGDSALLKSMAGQGVSFKGNNFQNYGAQYQNYLSNYNPQQSSNSSGVNYAQYGENSAQNPQTSFGQTIPQGYAAYTQGGGVPDEYVSSETQQASALPFQALSKQEVAAMEDFYAKNLEPSQSLTAAVTSGVAFGALMMNPRVLAHPWNFLTTTFNPNSKVNQLFAEARKSGTALHEAWKQNSVIMEEAYSQMHRAEARSKWKFGAFRKRYTAAEIEKLEGIMKKALTPGADGKIDINKVARATEELRHAYTSNGWLMFGKNGTVESQLAGVAEKGTANAKAVRDNTAKLLKYRNSNMTFSQAFQKSGGKMGAAFGAIEILMNAGKIKTAFEEDTGTGMKQLGQTLIKATANTGGWMLGETAGHWANAKWGAKLGAKVHPVLGTAVGAIAGILGGSIGMWLCGKVGKGIAGEDVANKIEAKKLAKTEEGQLQLTQSVIQGVQSGQEVNPYARQGAQKLLSLYA